MMTKASEQALEGLRDPATLKWYVIPLLALVFYVYAREVRALELVHIWFFARGAVFNSMKCAGAQYTICSCPTPENEGGCVLTNWYYYGGTNRSLVPAEDNHGRRRDAEGNVLPCLFFPVRARRSCIGCGCDHTQPGPRKLRAALAQSDRLEASLKRNRGRI